MENKKEFNYAQLKSKANYYKSLISTLHEDTIKSTVHDMIEKNELPSTAENLISDCPETASFYMLPKIHKPNNLGRPIISAHSCPTVHIAQYLDQIMQPIVHQLPTFVQDSSHALRILNSVQLQRSI